MKKPVLIVSGCDANFYPFMSEALASLFALHLEDRADIGILDLGLTAEQISALQAKGCTVKQSSWSLDVPEDQKKSYHIGLVARTTLRDDFPGYDIYLWFDADAWAQTPEFFALMVEGAKQKGAAVIRETGAGCRRGYLYNRWWYGHMVAAYGLINGLRVAYPPAINIGLLALSATAPHWQAWRKEYQMMIHRRGKVNMDQHAFNAMISLGNFPVAEIPPRCNWICTLSPPFWNPETKLLCEPTREAAPLSVLHLAGVDKRRAYTLHQTSGGDIRLPLTYEAYIQR